MNNILDVPVFKQFKEDCESLGLRIANHKTLDSVEYALVSARSNARWWMIPLENRHVTVSGFAMFQPLLFNARILKKIIVMLSSLGLSNIWATQRLHVSGKLELYQYFPSISRLVYAFFTGTDSPHRKTAIQVMDDKGNLLGFAKASRNSKVAKLLLHEAAVLKKLQLLNLNTAYIPRVLFTGTLGDSMLLVTDTLKTNKTATTTRFTAVHLNFLKELYCATKNNSLIEVAKIADSFIKRIEGLKLTKQSIWRERLNSAVSLLVLQADLFLPASLSHGDFTPWNTFIVENRLYVFDWEYSEDNVPIGNDIIHFKLNEPKNRARSPSDKLLIALTSLNHLWVDLNHKEKVVSVIIYLLTQCLRQIERLTSEISELDDWDGAGDYAAMIDELVINKF